MTDITLTINESANGETVYCKELGKFLQVFILDQSVIDNQKQEALNKLANAQAAVDALDAVLVKRAEAIGG